MKTEFKANDVAICRDANGYNFTEGKRYTILEYDPPDYWGNGFTCPAYVSVIDDTGKKANCHANRFVPATSETQSYLYLHVVSAFSDNRYRFVRMEANDYTCRADEILLSAYTGSVITHEA